MRVGRSRVDVNMQVEKEDNRLDSDARKSSQVYSRDVGQTVACKYATGPARTSGFLQASRT